MPGHISELEMKIKNYGKSPYGFYANGECRLLNPGDEYDCGDSIPDGIEALLQRDDYPLSVVEETVSEPVEAIEVEEAPLPRDDYQLSIVSEPEQSAEKPIKIRRKLRENTNVLSVDKK